MADHNLADPMGRAIVFHDHTWYGHIVVVHEEMAAHRKLADLAISDPLENRFSSSDPDCRLYYGQADRTGLMIVVVADVAEGAVKTAYRAKRFKQGEVEWSSRTR